MRRKLELSNSTPERVQISTCLIVADRANPCIAIVWVQREGSTQTDQSTLLPQGAVEHSCELWCSFLAKGCIAPYFVTVHVKKHLCLLCWWARLFVNCSLSTLSIWQDCPAQHARAAGWLTAAFTYASEPQLRVRDFCVSLSDLPELRWALNFPSLAGHPWIWTGSKIWNHKNFQHAAGMLLQIPSFESFLGTLPLKPRFFFHHLVLHVCPSIWRIENSRASLWNPRYSKLEKLEGDLPEHSSFASVFSLVMPFSHELAAQCCQHWATDGTDPNCFFYFIMCQ